MYSGFIRAFFCAKNRCLLWLEMAVIGARFPYDKNNELKHATMLHRAEGKCRVQRCPPDIHTLNMYIKHSTDK